MFSIRGGFNKSAERIRRRPEWCTRVDGTFPFDGDRGRDFDGRSALAIAGETEQTAPLMASPAKLECRPGCGACCIAPSISPSWPSLPYGKPAGERCPHLTADNRCAIFGSADRPAVCGGIQPAAEMCGDSSTEAMATLVRWEALTAPRR
jgi:uncharacterized protein